MINGTHILIYSNDPAADRAFFRDVLEFRHVNVGGGWLIFALPPAEAGIHPAGEIQPLMHGGRSLLTSVLYLMCDDLDATIASLGSKNAECSPVEEADWGRKTTVRLPSGGEIGLYQPKHATAFA
jgi:hypothetical protein